MINEYGAMIESDDKRGKLQKQREEYAQVTILSAYQV
jgi:hypothetical protein